MASFLKGKRLERYCTEPYPTLKEIGMEHADDAMRPHFDRFVDLPHHDRAVSSTIS
jgi:hypothetical protein